MTGPEPTNTNRPNGGRRRNPMAVRRQQAVAAASAAVAEQLGETNKQGIGRLMEIFGVELVTRVAENAKERYSAAQDIETPTDAPTPDRSPVTTTAGTPRTLGGVFFYLMREHANSLGLEWYGLHIPSPPRNGAPTPGPRTQQLQRAAEAPTEEVKQPSQATQKAPAVIAPPAAPAVIAPPAAPPRSSAAQQAPSDDSAAPKPNRIKATVIGIPRGEPQQTDQPGVLQLMFDVEMSPSMPKGLPTLGRSRVVVLCTEKQYRPIAAAGGVTGRMLVEGEIAPTLSAAGKPIQVLVCTRLTTLDIEQAKRNSQNSGG